METARETDLAGAKWRAWIDAIEAARDDDAVIATDNAMCVYFGAIPAMTMRSAGNFHFPTGFGTLGFTVPVAVGAALAAPDRQVIGITGDGGLLFTATELAVAAAEQLSIAVVVFDNSGYGEIRAECSSATRNRLPLMHRLEIWCFRACAWRPRPTR